MTGPTPVTRLQADCQRCFALCCVAPAFAASTDFAIDKAAGVPCPNLLGDFRCGIHDRLRDRGFAGCSAYDCFGAGQQVAQVSFGGHDWRQTPQIAEQTFAVFAVMRALHELLWYVTEALGLPGTLPVHEELRHTQQEIERLTYDNPDALCQLDIDAHRRPVNALLVRASKACQGRTRRTKAARPPGCRADRQEPQRRRPQRGEPARSAARRIRPHWRGPQDGRPHRCRPAGRRPQRGRPDRLHLPHPIPARFRGRGRRDPVAPSALPAGILAGCPGVVS